MNRTNPKWPGLSRTLIAVVVLITLGANLASCKAMARAAAKYWTKKQIKNFIANCETKTAKLVGEEKAARFCDCAVEPVAEKYHNFDDAKDIKALEIIQIANDCRKQ